MKRYQSRDPEKSYNVQSWASPIDVAKLIEAIENWTGEKSSNMSEVVRLGLQIAAIATGSYQNITKELDNIDDAFKYIDMKGFTMHQRTDRRRHIIGRAMATDDMRLDNMPTLHKQQISGEYISGIGAPKIPDSFDSSLLASPIISPNIDKFPIEPEEHKGTCKHSGLILDDGINCNKCGFFVPNEETSHE